MHVKAKPYRDTWAAPGSQLFEALEAGDAKKAAEIYEECEWEARKLLEKCWLYDTQRRMQTSRIAAFGE